MDQEKLNKEIEEKPEKAGVYIFRDGEVPVYVGKAVDIRDRLRSYRDPRSTRIAKMVEKADSIDHRVTGDEKEALLLEANLIKKFQPKYNTRLKDSKSYPVIQFTSDKFPAIEATRDPDEEATVFGPYTSMKRVENCIKSVRDIYGITSSKCKRMESEDDPCMDYQIGLCSAPYAGRIEPEEYTKNLEEAKKVFEESPEDLIQDLKEEMKEASREKKYERAATLRDYIENLESLGGDRSFSETGLTHVLALNKALDRIGVLVMEQSTIKEKEFYRLSENAESKQDALKAFITQSYASDTLPEKIVSEVRVEDEEINAWLESEGVDYKEPEDGRERVLLDSAKSAAQRPKDTKMEDLGEILELKVERMECFDVSHTGGKDVVGSNVVFEDDKPVKSDYRKKKLKEENDDYENMYRLLKWRAQRQVHGRDERPEPDLLLIDGGEGQLDAAAEALREVGWSMPVFGIVKPDDKILGLHRNPEIPEDTGQILSAIRDEAHRFAKKYHESRRDGIEPILEEVDGLGEKKRKALMQEFTVEELKEASTEDMETVEGIGEEMAEKIDKYLEDG
ncbi:MAG: excinuclease ABC subunit C [Candidatus Nanosalina sp. J07AB43]|nr:MAG: excinuclease ABC subunit C [Candidatus Nanosalina sp. J07AB43]